MDYKQRLVKLHLLPLTLWLEVQDIMFFISLVQSPPDNFNLSNFIKFSSSATRSSTMHKIHSASTHIPRLNSTRHFYFNRIVRIWNSLPPLNLDLSYQSLKHSILDLYWDYFVDHYDINIPCSWSKACLCTSCTS